MRLSPSLPFYLAHSAFVCVHGCVCVCVRESVCVCVAKRVATRIRHVQVADIVS